MRGQRRCIVFRTPGEGQDGTDPDVFHCGTISTLYVLPGGSSVCCSSAFATRCAAAAPLPAVSACRKRDVEGASHSLTNGIMIHLGGFVPVDETSLETRWLVIMTWEPGVKLYWAASDTIGGTREK